MKRLIPSLMENYLSPLGELTLAADAEGLIGAWFEHQKHYGSVGTAGIAFDMSTRAEGPSQTQLSPRDVSSAHLTLNAAKTWLDAYFSGRDPGAGPDCPVDPGRAVPAPDRDRPTHSPYPVDQKEDCA